MQGEAKGERKTQGELVKGSSRLKRPKNAQWRENPVETERKCGGHQGLPGGENGLCVREIETSKERGGLAERTGGTRAMTLKDWVGGGGGDDAGRTNQKIK